MTTVDYLVVGSGLTGATIARVLADDHREVLVLERRPRPGGNVVDSLHPSKIRVHSYGPHYFRCSSPKVWDFVGRFATFYRYEPKVLALVKGRYENWPPNEALLRRFPGWEEACPTGRPRNFEEACLQKLPRPVYELLVRGYTERQWGMDASLLGVRLAKRIHVNRDGQTTLTPNHFHRVLPVHGYARLMQNLLGDIPCRLGVDYLQHRAEYRARKALVFTGSLDEFFGFDSGRLGYRSQRRLHQFLPSCDLRQPCGQINYPNARTPEPLRTIEWKHLLPPEQRSKTSGTVITGEHPFTPDDPDQFEYPVPTGPNLRLYRQYRARARAMPKLVVCGRLGTYRYLDMNHALSHALAIGEELISPAGDAQPVGNHEQPAACL